MSNMSWYLYYKGVYYDVGTKVRIKTRWGEIVTATFVGGGNYKPYVMYFNLSKPESYIVEILEPVYYKETEENVEAKKENIFTSTGSGSWSSHDDVFHGFLLYIAVMAVTIIFKERIGLWILETLIFFGWKAKK